MLIWATEFLNLLIGLHYLNILDAFGYGLETVIGPIEIKHSWSPETQMGFTWFSWFFV
jgi:hypothetical protein